MGFTAIPVSFVHNIIVSPSHRFFSFDSRFPMMHHFNATAGTGRIQRCTTKISAARLIPMYIGNRRHHPQTIGFYDGKTIPTLSSCCSRIVVSSALMSNEESGDIIHTINKNNNITTNNNYSKELDIAVSAVQLACSLCQRLQEDFVLATNTCHNQIESKGDLSPVTVADWSVQATVSWVLSEHFGNENVSLIAEEDVLTLRRPDSAGLLQSVVSTVNNCLVEASKYGLTGPKKTLNSNEILEAISRCNSLGGPRGRYWVLDPVDGTLGFVRGDQYAVALALIEDGKIILGVLGCPNYPMKRAWLDYHQRYYRIMSKWSPPSFGLWHKGCVMYAKKGSGEAWMQPLVHDRAKLELPIFVKPIQVSTVDDPGMAIFCEPVEKANSSHSFTAGLAQSVGLRKQPLRVYSMVKYAAIARGDAEIFMKFARAGYKEKIWDHAAGVVIIEEAGGVVTDARGSPLDFSKGIYLESLDRGIIACSGASLHEKIIRAVDASWDSSGL